MKRRPEYAQSALKRAVDLLGSSLGLVVGSWLLLLLGLLVKVDSRGPVFYRGVRIGKDGHPFRIFKFRTMTVDAEGSGPLNVGERDPRVTRVGTMLRKTKLDEIPQLINVLKGEMSLVGPRPDVAEYVALYSEEERNRILRLKPGITDWASIVNYDQSVEFTRWRDPDAEFVQQIRPVKVRLQLLYAERASLWEDVRILLWTVRKLLLRDRALPEELSPYLRADQQSEVQNDERGTTLP